MNKFRFIYLFFILVTLKFSVSAQRINDFNLAPQDNGINVSFSIGPGYECSGYSIYHCLDSMSYVEVYNYAGICGTSPTKEFKSFLHTTAGLNQVNYYKVQLFPYEVAYNRIMYSNSALGSLLAYPNPVSPQNYFINVKIANANNLKVEGYVCDAYGIKIQGIENQSQGNDLEIPVSALKEGVYLVWLSDGARIYTTKFIVLSSY